MTTPNELKKMYEQGQNINAFLREKAGVHHNTENIIEISYDLQSGSYIALMSDEKMVEHKKQFSHFLVQTIKSLCEPTSIMEAGVGEATTFSGVLSQFRTGTTGIGFDLSWSRLAYARGWLKGQGLSNTNLVTASLLNIPFSDDAIDIVYTAHTIEPNGGNEEPILRELFRVTRKYLILLEPSFEHASEEGKKRMEFHGYCKNLTGICQALGYTIIHHELLPFSINPANPTAITIIRKSEITKETFLGYVCPKYKTPLQEINGMMFSPEGLVVYPILGGIPCLRIENGIIASKYPEMMKAG